MKCKKCGGLMLNDERGIYNGVRLDMYRCISCGLRWDEVISENRKGKQLDQSRNMESSRETGRVILQY